MNDQELRRLLVAVDEDRPLAAGDEANARASMFAEFDGRPVADVIVAVPQQPEPRGRRWWPGVAAAALVLVIGGVLLLMDRDSEPAVPVDSIDTVDTVAPVETDSYLRACVDFRARTTLDGDGWKAVLDRFVSEQAVDQAYLDALAIQLEILATAPRAASFASELRSVAAEARAGADPASLALELREIEQLSVRAAGIDCLS